MKGEVFPEAAFDDAVAVQTTARATTPLPPPPAPYQPRADNWRSRATGAPAWVKSFAASGSVATIGAAHAPVVISPAETAAKAERKAAWTRWMDLSRELSQILADAAAVILATEDGSALRAAAVQRSIEASDELERLRIARDAGKPMVLQRFPELNAGPVAVDSRKPHGQLFDHQAASANDNDDIFDAMGG